MSESSELEYTASAPGNLQPRAAQSVNSIRATFYSDQGATGKHKVLAVKKKDYPTFESLQDYLSSALSVRVRNITTPLGRHKVRDFDDLTSSGSYVCSSKAKVKGVSLARRTWNAGSRLPAARMAFMAEDGKGSLKHRPLGENPNGSDPGYPPRKRRQKKLTVIRNGDELNRTTFLINLNSGQGFEELVHDIGQNFACRSDPFLYTESGRPVNSMTDIIRGPDCYIVAEPSEKFVPLDKPPNPRKGGLKTVAAWGDNKKARTQAETRGKWSLTVITSDREDAGTTANVTITVYGTKSVSHAIPLNNSDGDFFMSGNVDQFEISVGNIGKIFKIRLAHDDAGESPSWLCDEVKMKDIHTNEELNFECRRWISSELDDLETCRELAVSRPGEPVLPICVYQVISVTGDLWNAAPDANIYITVYGENGDTGVRRLARENVEEKFKKGQTDAFQIEAVQLGKLKRVIVGHDGNLVGQGWYLDRLSISEAGGRSSHEYTFPCNRWLDGGEEDGKIVRELKVQEEYLADLMEKQAWEYEKWKFETGNYIRLYSVSSQRPVRIKPDATVDADGDYDDPLASTVLKTQTIFKCIARRSNIRVFQSVNHEKFHLAIDNAKLLGQKGRGGAYCEMRVRVQPNRSLMFESVKFTGQHLSISHLGKPEDPRTGGTRVEKNRLFYAYCKGTLRHRGIIMLCTSMSQTLTMDEDNVLVGTGKRNQVAQFRVHKVSEGNIRMFESIAFPKQFLRMKEGRCDALGSGDEYCKFRCIRVRDQGYVLLESIANRNIYLGMMEDGKVKPTIDTGDVNTHFYPEVIEFGDKKGEEPKEKEQKTVEKPRRKRRQPAALEPLPVEPAPPKQTPREESAQSIFEEGDWKVWINTTETAQNADVVLVVYGDAGSSGPIILGTAGQQDMFAAGNQDQFKINLGTVGKIYKIRLELAGNNKRKLPSWSLKDVKLKDMTTKETYRFKVNSTLSHQYDLMREMAVSRPKEPVLPVVSYTVLVYTTDVESADTDANVSLNVYGERGDWGKRLLHISDHSTKFEQGQVDKFTVLAVSLGELRHCVLSHDGEDPFEGWLCEKVVIRPDDDAGREWVFPCGRWLDSGIDDKVLETVLELEGWQNVRDSLPEIINLIEVNGWTKVQFNALVILAIDKEPLSAGWNNVKACASAILSMYQDGWKKMQNVAPRILGSENEVSDGGWERLQACCIDILATYQDGWEKVQNNTNEILGLCQVSPGGWIKVRDGALEIIELYKGGWERLQSHGPDIHNVYYDLNNGWENIQWAAVAVTDLYCGGWKKVQNHCHDILSLNTDGWKTVQSQTSAIMGMYKGGWGNVQRQSNDILSMYKGGWKIVQNQSSAIIGMYKGGWIKMQRQSTSILSMYRGGWNEIQKQNSAILCMFKGGWKTVQSQTVAILDMSQGGWENLQYQSTEILRMSKDGWKNVQQNSPALLEMYQGGWEKILENVPAICNVGKST